MPGINDDRTESAIRTLSALRAGCHPATGELLPPAAADVLHSRDVQSGLEAGERALSRLRPLHPTSAAQFLEAVFGNAVSAERQIVIWGKDAGSVWASSSEEAVTAVTPQRPYVHACLHSSDLRTSPGHDLTRGRGVKTSATCVPGLWADIDIASSDKRRPYPTDLASAIDLALQHPIGVPTLIVETGGGIHAWWLLDEPVALSSDTDREEAQWLSTSFGASLLEVAKENDWSIDSVWDLARVLRCPGVVNSKYGRESKLIYQSGERYSIQAVHEAERLRELRRRSDKSPSTPPGAVLARPEGGACPAFNMTPNPRPAQALDSLLEADQRLADTWDLERPDLAYDDSRIEMSLAGRLQRKGLPVQEIVDTCRYWRRTRAEKRRKAERRDYYENLIRKLFEDEGEASFDPTLGDYKPEAPAPVPSRRSSSAYDLAEDHFGMPFSGGPSRFRTGRWLLVGDVSSLCPDCGGPLIGMRRPYSSAGKAYHYWALACAGCAHLLAPVDLDKDSRAALYKESIHRPGES